MDRWERLEGGQHFPHHPFGDLTFRQLAGGHFVAVVQRLRMNLQMAKSMKSAID